VILERIVVGNLETNCYIFGSSRNKEVVVIDPGGDVERIMAVLYGLAAQVCSIVNTHGHVDHILGNRSLKKRTGAEILIHRADGEMLIDSRKNFSNLLAEPVTSPPADRLLEGGDLIRIGELSLKVVHTPGHSPGGISLIGDGLVFTGDTLFSGSIGRWDFPGASYNLLLASVRNKLLVLEDETVVYPGHGPSSTIGAERRHNPFFSSHGSWP
jgi:glyoxylase-like metal-dependent hydrolase (beta-lactamase superfamily II)